MIEFKLRKKDAECDHHPVLSSISINPNITKEEILELVKKDFLSKINLIKSVYPNFDESISMYEIMDKFTIKDTYIDEFDEYCLGCIEFPSVNRKLFGKGEWPIFYVRIHKINDRLEDQNNVLTYYISR